MKKFIVIMIFIFSLLVVSACSEKSLELDFSEPFSEEQVVHALEENFSKLNKVEIDLGEEDEIEGMVPSVYQPEDDDGYIYLYVFDSLAERKEAGSWNSFFGYDYELNKKRMYAANNVLIKYQWTDDHIKHVQTAEELSDIILKQLNPYEEVSFFGQSENWIGYYKIGSYNYAYEDKSGTFVHDRWGLSAGKAMYKWWEPGDEIWVSYNYNVSSSGGGGNRTLTNGVLNLGRSSGNVFISDSIKSIQIEMNWDGQQEIVTLNKNDVEIRYEVENEVPDIVKEMAHDHLRINIDYYDSLEEEKVVDAKITGLTKIETGTASETVDIQMWLLEYRILSESDDPLLLAGGMTLDDGWRTEYSSAGQPIIVVARHHEGQIWQKVNMTNTLTISEEYNDDYSEAAVSMYEKYILTKD